MLLKGCMPSGSWPCGSCAGVVEWCWTEVHESGHGIVREYECWYGVGEVEGRPVSVDLCGRSVFV